MNDPYIINPYRKNQPDYISTLIKALRDGIITEKQFKAMTAGFISFYVKETTENILDQGLKTAIKSLIAHTSNKSHANY